MTGPEPVSDPDALVPFIEGTTGSVFNIIEVESLVASANETIEQFFSILGWRLKALPDFASESSPLGVILDLGSLPRGPGRDQEQALTSAGDSRDYRRSRPGRDHPR